MRISDWSSDVCSSDLRVAQSVRAPVQEEGAGVALSREVCLGERVVLFAVGIAAAGDDAAGEVELGATGEGVAGGVDQAVLAGHAGAGHQEPVDLASRGRSAERRVGEACGDKGRAWWAPSTEKKKTH